jgi:altronate dehydratase small subunit
MNITAMMINQEADNVGVVTVAAKKGDIARFQQGGQVKEVTLLSDVPIYHKFCVRAVGKNEPVIKYGEQLGLAGQDIKVGDYVHTHNLISQRDQ